MATSGSIDFNQTQTELITASLRKCGVLSEGETATAEQVQDASGDFNRMVKAWQAIGVHMWTHQELVLFPVKNQSKFSLGATGDRATTKDDFVNTTLSAAASSGASTITVTSITGMADADQIGIVQDDGTIHWTTINGTPSGSTVTLTAVTTAAASSGNRVYVYTNIAQRPLKILQARLQTSETSEIEMTQLSESDYFRLSNKTADGTPTQFFYRPTLTNGSLYVWPEFDDITMRMNMTVLRAIEDFDSLTDNADFPQEWLQALVWNLAKEICIEYGVDDSTYNKILSRAAETFFAVDGFDRENSITFMPDLG